MRSVGRSAAILTGASAAVQIVGLGRELFIAAQVGLSRNLDALLVALVVPLTLAGLLTTGTVTALIPAYVQVRTDVGLVAARRLAGVVITSVVLAASAIVAALIIFGDFVISLVGPGLGPGAHGLAVSYLALLAPVTIFSAATAVLTSICQAEQRFATIAMATMTGPVIALVVLLGLWSRLGLEAYAIGSLAGGLATVVLLIIIMVRQGIGPLPNIAARGLGIRGLLRHATPLTLSGAILQINVIADRAVASLTGAGAVSALRFGEVIVRAPITAIAPSWSAAMYPAQVHAAGKQDQSVLGATTARTISYAIVGFTPITVLLIALAPLVVEVMYGRGQFNQADVVETSQVVAAFAPLILGMMIIPVLAGAHNARRRGSVLLAAGIANVTINVTLDIALSRAIGVAGIALASSVTALIMIGFLATWLARTERGFSLSSLARTAVKSLGAVALPAAVVGSMVWGGGFGRGGGARDLLLLVVLGGSALAAYALLAARIGVEEVGVIARVVAGRIPPLRRFVATDR